MPITSFFIVRNLVKSNLSFFNIKTLIALVIKDIDNGLVALGGQTSIGRGLFKVENVTLNGEKLDLDNAISKILGGVADE